MTLIIIFLAALTALVFFLILMHLERISGKRFLRGTRTKVDTTTLRVAKHLSTEAPKTGKVLARKVTQRAKLELGRHSKRLHGAVRTRAQRVSEQVRTTNGVTERTKPASPFIRDVLAHKHQLREQRKSKKKL